jgi:hypothetical protein
VSEAEVSRPAGQSPSEGPETDSGMRRSSEGNEPEA